MPSCLRSPWEWSAPPEGGAGLRTAGLSLRLPGPDGCLHWRIRPRAPAGGSPGPQEGSAPEPGAGQGTRLTTHTSSQTGETAPTCRLH